MSDSGAWITEDSMSSGDRFDSALRQLHSLRCIPTPTPDRPAGPDGPATGGPLPEASAELFTLLTQLAAITAELEHSDETAADPTARRLLADISDGLDHAQHAAMALLVSYRTEDGTAWCRRRAQTDPLASAWD
ncbi:hypothetical protein XF36_29140 (plasmid) [Pseudonocardia sp. HH130629-09]|nr:hypothetical protein XF36_29140 [Pseudonocardia sp. HH130629-09]